MAEVSGLWSDCLVCAALTDIGLRRANNQDAYAVALAADQAEFDRRGHLFMVADGMGAHAAGELASKIATDVVSLSYRKLPDQSPPQALQAAVLDANRQIRARGDACGDFRGMGTTATVLVLLPAGGLVAHVGDSRAYRLRGRQIEQLTFDHSLVWEVRASGQLADPALANYISKNIITRSLGPALAVQVDLEGPFPVQPGDTFLLCSDGLSNQVANDEIGLVLSCLPPKEAAQALIDLACLRGGPDNITAVIVRVLGPQVARGAAQSAPTVHPPSAKHRPVPPLIWIVLGVAALATAGLAGMGHPWMSLVSFLAAVAALAAALVRYYGGPDGGTWESRHFGRGPYVTADGTPTFDLLARLTGVTQQLRAAAAAEKWSGSVDWTEFDQRLTRARTSVASINLMGDAAAEQLRAISSIMSQLRRQGEPGTDSGVLRL